MLKTHFPQNAIYTRITTALAQQNYDRDEAQLVLFIHTWINFVAQSQIFLVALAFVTLGLKVYAHVKNSLVALDGIDKFWS